MPTPQDSSQLNPPPSHHGRTIRSAGPILLSARRDGAATCGFAAFLSVLDFLLWGGAVSATGRPYDSTTIYICYAIPCFLVAGAALVALAALPRLRGAFARRPGSVTAAEALGLGGGTCTLATLLSAQSAYPALLCLTATLIGLGLAAGLYGWGNMLARLTSKRLVGVVGCACVLFPLASLALVFSPVLPKYLLSGMLICASVALRRMAHLETAQADLPANKAVPAPDEPSCRTAPTEAQPVGAQQPAPSLRAVWDAYGVTSLSFASLGLVAGLSRLVSLSNGANNLVVMLGSPLFTLVAGIVLLALWHLRGRIVTPTGFYQAAFPFAATGFVVFSLTGLGFATAFACFANFFFEFMLVVIAIHTVNPEGSLGARRLPSYCLALGLALVFACLGTVTSLLTRDLWVGSLPGFALSIVVCIYVLSMALVLQMRGSRPPAGDAHPAAPDATPAQAVHEVPTDPASRIESAIAGWAARMADAHGLTAREQEILVLVVRGSDTPSIAAALGLSDNTVRTHKKSLYRKLDVHSKQELLAMMQQPADSDAGKQDPR